MGTLIGIFGIVAPAFLVFGLAAWSWRFIRRRVLYVIVALIVAYGLQSLAIDPVMSYLLRNAASSVEAVQSIAAYSLAVSAAVAGLIALPLLRTLALALRKDPGSQ